MQFSAQLGQPWVKGSISNPCEPDVRYLTDTAAAMIAISDVAETDT
jgi:hypothetical protein